MDPTAGSTKSLTMVTLHICSVVIFVFLSSFCCQHGRSYMYMYA